MKQFSELGIKTSYQGMEGEKIGIEKILNRQIVVHKYSIHDSKYQKENNEKCLHVQISVSGIKHVLFTGSQVLMQDIQKVPPEDFPFSTTIVKENKVYKFT